MIPIRSAKELSSLDQKTIELQEISSWDLMERAVDLLSSTLLEKIDFEDITILCGPGNNGGDGLGVARKLAEAGIDVEVYTFRDIKKSADAQKNLEQLPESVDLNYFEDGFEPTSYLALDALFGYGLDRPLEGGFVELVEAINESFGFVVSVDMPSGLPAEPIFEFDENQVVRANHVLTFHSPKLSLLLPYASGTYKTFEVLDIQLEDYDDSRLNYIESSDVGAFLHEIDKFDHKYTRGVVNLVGGSTGKSGSIALAGKSCLRTGAGIVELTVPNSVVPAFVSQIPELMYSVCGEDHLDSLHVHEKTDAVGIGPGMGQHKDSKTVFTETLKLGKPLIIDADALTWVENELPADSILTPHEGEFKRLVGDWDSESDKLEKLKALSTRLKSVVVLKGAHTIICDGDRLYFNSSGHPAMATAGAGDVLLGVISAFRAQGYEALDASIIGVYCHGLAAQLYLEENSAATMLASDISDYLGKAIAFVQG